MADYTTLTDRQRAYAVARYVWGDTLVEIVIPAVNAEPVFRYYEVTNVVTGKTVGMRNGHFNRRHVNSKEGLDRTTDALDALGWRMQIVRVAGVRYLRWRKAGQTNVDTAIDRATYGNRGRAVAANLGALTVVNAPMP